MDRKEELALRIFKFKKRKKLKTAEAVRGIFNSSRIFNPGLFGEMCRRVETMEKEVQEKGGVQIKLV